MVFFVQYDTMRRDTKERTDSSRIEALSRRAVMDTVDYDGDANKVTDESRRELIITSKICGTSEIGRAHV